jgi:hypothetical protein
MPKAKSIFKSAVDYFRLKESPPVVQTTSRLQTYFVIVSILNLLGALVLATFINCPYERPDYLRALCKPIKFKNGDQLQTFSNYVLQVRDPFDYTGRPVDIVALYVVEYLKDMRSNYTYEMMLGRIETSFKSTNKGGGGTYLDIYRQRTYKPDNSVGTIYCSQGDYSKVLDPSTDCTGVTDQNLIDVTQDLAQNVVDYINYPYFTCTSCWDSNNVKFSDIVTVIQSWFAIYGSLMTPTAIVFALLIKNFSTEAKKKEDYILSEINEC